jgi:TRAP-type C4-dicarboxylate transport system substrate-binding protein
VFGLNRKTILLGGVGVAAMAFAAVQAPVNAEEIKLTVISGHPPVIGSVKNLKGYFIPEVTKRLAAKGSKYKIKWTQAYAGSVAKPPAVFEAIEEGLADIGHIGMLFEAAKAPLESVSYVTPFGSGDLNKVLAAVDQVGKQVPEMNKAYGKFGQRLLARVGVDDYHILTTWPVNKLEDLKGKKIGAGGIAATWIRGTGATPVRGNLTTYYNAVKTGVYQGLVVFGSGIPAFKYYEVTKNLTKVSFGAMFSSSITINSKRWDGLPAEVKQVINEVIPGYRSRAIKHYVTRGKGALKLVATKGMKVHEMAFGERRRWAMSLPNIAQNWAKRTDKKGQPGSKVLKAYMDISRKSGVVFARNWDKE